MNSFNLPAWLSGDYSGGAFVMFGWAHLAALLTAALFVGYFAWKRDKLSGTARRRWRYGMAALLLINDLVRHVWYAVNGLWSVQIMLPLHLCSLMAYVTAYMLITLDYRAYEFMYFLGIAGGMQALMTPSLGQYGFPHYLFWQTYIWHGIIVVAALYMTFVEGYRPTLRSLGKVIIGTNIFLVIVAIANPLLGSNYMFIANKPLSPTLLDYLGPWPWYILSMEIAGIALCSLLYVPFAVRNMRTAQVTA